MTLLHYSAKPLVGPIFNTREFQDAWWKPKGLWITTPGEDDWPSYARKVFGRQRISHCSEIILASDHKVLFTDPWRLGGLYAMKSRITGSGVINWPKVAEKYQGVVIAPYCWEARIELDWYYSWDVASGCIWDPVAIAEIRRVETLSPILSSKQ